MVSEHVASRSASWDKVGGAGAIEPFPTNLSLVVSQTADVHDQIADLLEQLRRMQDVQVTVETCLLQVPKSLLSPQDLPGFVVRDISELEARGVENVGGPMRLSESKTALLLDAAKQNGDSQVVSFPRMTLFNGQSTAVSATKNGRVDSTIQFHAVGSITGQFVGLKVAADGKTKLDELLSETMGAGESLLLRVHESVAKAWMDSEYKSGESSILRNIPYNVRLFKTKPVPVERVALLLVTPRMVVAEQEQELVDPSK